MKKSVVILFSLFLCYFQSFSQIEAITKEGKIALLYENGKWLYADSVPLYSIKPIKIPSLEIPFINNKDKPTYHTGFTLLFNDKYKVSNWVAYVLTKERTNGIYERTNKFSSDPLIKKKMANDKDYSKSGYDRGHLAPAADMEWSETTVEESFYYSNICPQEPGFNRGIWKRLEELVRELAIVYDTIYVVTGPVLTVALPTVGSNNISVPNYFYKVILDYSYPGIKGIGFIIPNLSSSSSLQSYAVTIDSVQKLTGLNFFPALPDDQEVMIENTLCKNCWTWNTSKKEDSKEKLTTSVQCKGITKSGNRCKNMTLNPSGYCYLHENQSKNPNTEQSKEVKKAETPTGTTKSGEPTYTGPRGGQYHYSKSGKKVYEKKK